MGLDDTKDEHSEVSFNAFCDFMGIPNEDRTYALLVWTAGYLAAEHYYGLDEDCRLDSTKTQACAVMGIGDQLIATGLARGAAARGKRIAFGDRSRIIWDGNSPAIFKGNPNIAAPGSEGAADIEWVEYYKGKRIYNRHEKGGDRWIWNYDFEPTPGEIYFDAAEQDFAASLTPGFILIEPNVPWWKPVAPNKSWGLKNFQAVADRLTADGYDLAQFAFGPVKVKNVRIIETPTFRHALAALSRARLAIIPEGGIHHGAAAVNLPAVVLFGGFIPPKVTGYRSHINLTGGAEACGVFTPCPHCAEAMARISVDEVMQAAKDLLEV